MLKCHILGHKWTNPTFDEKGRLTGHECSRCKTFEGVGYLESPYDRIFDEIKGLRKEIVELKEKNNG